MNNFDFITPYYDRIAGLIFGNSIKNSQKTFLDSIPPSANILILGGGTGWIVKEIFHRYNDVSITYVEKSEKMIEVAKSQLSDTKKCDVKFVCQSFENFDTTLKYNVVICNFFLDLFSERRLFEVIEKIKDHLKPNGQLLVSDFQINTSFWSKIWQKPLLLTMHIFFKLTSNLESDKIQSIGEVIENAGFEQRAEKFFFAKVIFSAVYCGTATDQ